MRAQDKSVLISGIGIAGPTLAYWLLQFGFKPTLVEHAPHLRSGSYLIDFWGLGYDVAERMGLLPALGRAGYQVEELRLVDDRGQRVGGFSVDVLRKMMSGRYLSIPRGDLASLIYGKIDGRCETLFDDNIIGIEQRDGGVQVRFEHAPERKFDLLVGAGGLHSQVRSLVFGSQDLFEKYLGYVVAAFEVEGYRPRDEGNYVSYSLPGRQVARFAMRDDRTMFLFVFASEQPLPVGSHAMYLQKNILHAKFRDAGWECRQILGALDGCDDLYFDRVSQIRMDRWSKGRVALIGDAAFCPSLLAGQGSALAMTAAYVLAGELARSEDNPVAAFQRYETLLRPLLATKQKAAEQFANGFAPRTRFGLFLRNQMTKAFAIPGVAKLLMGSSLFDRMNLPDYAIEESA